MSVESSDAEKIILANIEICLKIKDTIGSSDYSCIVCIQVSVVFAKRFF